MLTNILLWALFGLIAGAVAKMLLPGRDPGGNNLACWIITSLIGIGGAVLGGYLAHTVFGWAEPGGFDLRSFGVAVGGAVLLLILYRLVTSAGASTR